MKIEEIKAILFENDEVDSELESVKDAISDFETSIPKESPHNCVAWRILAHR